MLMDENKCKVFIRRLKQGGECFSIPGDGILIPIPYDYPSKMPECAELLSRWRVENPGLSPARFPVSNERTEKWLRNSILENDYRVMLSTIATPMIPHHVRIPSRNDFLSAPITEILSSKR